MEITQMPAIEDNLPLAIDAEGSEPQPGHWPKVTKPTLPADMVANSGNGLPMRESFLNQGIARYKCDTDIAAAE